MIFFQHCSTRLRGLEAIAQVPGFSSDLSGVPRIIKEQPSRVDMTIILNYYEMPNALNKSLLVGVTTGFPAQFFE